MSPLGRPEGSHPSVPHDSGSTGAPGRFSVMNIIGRPVGSPIVRTEGLRKVYQRGEREVTVLDGVTIDIERGEFVALMGPSGSGKSSLLNLIAGIDRPSGGLIEIDGVDIGALGETALADWRAATVGFVFQFYNLIPVLSALENVELPLMLTHLSRRERRQHAEAALDLVGLRERQDHRPNELSGGQQQRVAIARALVTDPALLVADEPTGDLDRRTGDEVLDLLGELHAMLGKTIVMVTHDPRAAARAQRRLTLENGLVVPAAEPSTGLRHVG
jgi:putative ABC transport system ATP-binding protein